MTLSLPEWIERQAAVSATKMAGAISATALTFRRPGFGQSVRPARGSILASPTTALGDAPDYFFHWLRDAAAVMEAMRLLASRAPDPAIWIERFEDCVRFSLDLGRLCGEGFLRNGDFRSKIQPDYLKYVRDDSDIAAVTGERVLDETRFNADGTLDFIRWPRPQHDGAALEALVAMRLGRDARSLRPELRTLLAELIRRDLDYAATRLDAPCYDIWEEELGLHYYPRLVQRTALEAGADWIVAEGDGARADRFRAAAQRLEPALDGFWSAEEKFYRSRLSPPEAPNPKGLDMSVILAALHAGRARGAHSVGDERMRATLARIERHFASVYPLNRGRAATFAFGRYPGDRYYDGSAWYLCSFAVAEFAYRRAALSRDPDEIARGDAVLDAVRAYVPDSGELSEQFHPETGAQLSARNLTWSYAAFITAWHARAEAEAAMARRA
ncbi:MAG TPA: glycoside hydrolase family 15 protein [Alphaproteobacteria bacterium]|jgi:glucoamylase